MPRRVIELKEWETRAVRLEDTDVTALIAHPQHPAVLEPSPIRGSWRLRAQAKVGAVRFEGFDLIVRPKAGLQNVFYLMGIERPRDWWGNDEVDLLVHHDFFAGIARLLAHTVERAIGRGVQHGYIERREPLVALRGRVDLREQLRHPYTPVPTSCRYDDYTADTKLNQLIRAALSRVLRLPGVPGTVRRTLHLQLSLLEEVAPVEPDLQWADKWQPSRLDRRYLPAVRLSALVLRRLVLSEAAGRTSAYSFLVDMNQLFERFIEEGLRRRLQATDSSILVIGQEQRHLDVENRLMIRPDIVIRRGASTAFVLDSKYILSGDGTTHVDHHAQLLSYAIRHDIKDVALVYVLKPSLIAPATDLVTTIRHAEVRIHSWALDLTREPAQIEAGMDHLAERVLDMCLHAEEARKPLLARPSIIRVIESEQPHVHTDLGRHDLDREGRQDIPPR
jgi:5-methylcytosine-specific restriction enzyme subunit McrC